MFVELKERLTFSSILIILVSEMPFVAYTDSLLLRVGRVLIQKERVVAYASCELCMHELNYWTYDLEVAVVVFAFKVWRHYLYEKNFKHFTDYKSLKYIFTQQDLNTR